MANYTLTVYEQNGNKLLEEVIEASTDQEAKELGEKRLEQDGFQNHTSRLTSPKGQLLIFHR